MTIFELQISGTDIGVLENGVFEGLNINRLSLPGNSIRRIQARAFEGLEDTLTFLSLYNNDLARIPKRVSEENYTDVAIKPCLHVKKFISG